MQDPCGSDGPVVAWEALGNTRREHALAIAEAGSRTAARGRRDRKGE
jgi:hypothetical protein